MMNSKEVLFATRKSCCSHLISSNKHNYWFLSDSVAKQISKAPSVVCCFSIMADVFLDISNAVNFILDAKSVPHLQLLLPNHVPDIGCFNKLLAYISWSVSSDVKYRTSWPCSRKEFLVLCWWYTAVCAYKTTHNLLLNYRPTCLLWKACCHIIFCS